MTRRDRESLVDDPNSLLFGDDDLDGEDGSGDYADGGYDDQAWDDQGHDDAAVADAGHGRGRHGAQRGGRTRRRGPLVVVLTLLIVVAVAVLVVPRVVGYFQVKDYSGAAGPTVSVTVQSGDSVADIGAELQKAGVVESTKAFTDAASSNSDATSIQPGTYRVASHISGARAVSALLDPSSRDTGSEVVVTEGATTLDVASRLTTVLGKGEQSAVHAALSSPAKLGLPITYRSGGTTPSSAEGFLYPATYTLSSTTKPTDALQQMVSRFVEQDRSSGFSDDAKQLGITPYQALIVASIAQAEAKFASDMPKVARVVLNRIKAHRPLQIDATSAYALKLAGKTKGIYSTVPGPYNTYRNAGLPPTPIDNPGAEAMNAAVHPATGDWLFYVNSDAAGHLFFTHSDVAFNNAAAKCRRNNWGCG